MVATALGTGMRRTLKRFPRFSRQAASVGEAETRVQNLGRIPGCLCRAPAVSWIQGSRFSQEKWRESDIVFGNGTFACQSVRLMCKDAGAEEESHKKDHEKKDREKEEDDEKRRVLKASLVYVPTLGWTEAAIAAGARDVNLSPSILGAFHRKEAALVEFFMDESLDELSDVVEEQSEELEKLVLHERLGRVMRIRLEMQAQYVSKWAQALSIQANPINLPVAMKQRAVLMDEMWHAVGDRSTDWDFYTKRAILGGVYTAAEVYMLTDYSPGFRDTWTFMERRIVDVIDCRKTAKEAAQLAQAIGKGLGNTIASFLNQPRSGP